MVFVVLIEIVMNEENILEFSKKDNCCMLYVVYWVGDFDKIIKYSIYFLVFFLWIGVIGCLKFIKFI